MKLLALALLFGFVSVTLQGSSESTNYQDVLDFLDNLKNSPELKNLLPDGLQNVDKSEIKDYLGNKLQKQIGKLEDKLKSTLGNGEDVKGALLDQINQLEKGLKNTDVDGKVKEFIQNIQNNGKDYVNKLVNNLDSSDSSSED